jgi:hypothetical protein
MTTSWLPNLTGADVSGLAVTLRPLKIQRRGECAGWAIHRQACLAIFGSAGVPDTIAAAAIGILGVRSEGLQNHFPPEPELPAELASQARWCPRPESNQQPTVYKTVALPIELQGR